MPWPCPSVCHKSVFYQNGYKRRIMKIMLYCSQGTVVFKCREQDHRVVKFSWVIPHWGSISLYLSYGAIQGHSYYSRLIGTRALWYGTISSDLEWPLTAPNHSIFSEYELTFTFLSSHSLYAIARPSVICLWSVMFVRPTQAVQIFGNISTALGTLAIHWHPLKISRRSS